MERQVQKLGWIHRTWIYMRPRRLWARRYSHSRVFSIMATLQPFEDPLFKTYLDLPDKSYHKLPRNHGNSHGVSYQIHSLNHQDRQILYLQRWVWWNIWRASTRRSEDIKAQKRMRIRRKDLSNQLWGACLTNLQHPILKALRKEFNRPHHLILYPHLPHIRIPQVTLNESFKTSKTFLHLKIQ